MSWDFLVFPPNPNPRSSTTGLVEVLCRSRRVDVITTLFHEEETFECLMGCVSDYIAKKVNTVCLFQVPHSPFPPFDQSFLLPSLFLFVPELYFLFHFPMYQQI